MRDIEKETKEFDELFEELTGMKPDDATVGEDGFLFITSETNLGNKDRAKRKRISDLAGYNGWRNHVVNDEYAGWWIRKPTLLVKSLAEDYQD